MTREDALIAMNGATLIGVADKLGVKAACNKTRTALKEAKAKVIARILEAEAALAEQEAETENTEPETQEPDEPMAIESAQEPEIPVVTEAQEPETAFAEPETQAAEAPTAAETPAATPKKKTEKKAKAEKPAQEPAEITAAVTALDDIFDKLNDLYFDGLLPKPSITIRRVNRAYDCCSVKKDEDNGEYSIGVCAHIIGKPITKTAAGLLHAMVHLYCMEMDIAETCQKGRYHNGKFKAECEDRDLVVEYDSANGFVHTTPSEFFSTNLQNAGLDLNMRLAAIPAQKKNTERS